MNNIPASQKSIFSKIINALFKNTGKTSNFHYIDGFYLNTFAIGGVYRFLLNLLLC
jgi:hypothetical protein